MNKGRGISILALILMIGLSQTAMAVLTDDEVSEIESRIFYNSAIRLLEEGEVAKASARLQWVANSYPETRHGAMARAELERITRFGVTPPPLDRLSRAGLVTFGTLFTTWLGVGSLILADVDTPQAYGVPLLVGPILGLVSSFALTEDAHLTRGQAALINFGGAWGVWQSIGTAIVLDLDDRPTVAASMAGGLAGLGLSTLLVKDRPLSSAQSTTITFGGIWGTWFSLCLSMIVDVQEEENILMTALIGGDIGLLAGAITAEQTSMSENRTRLINLSGIIGTLYGLGIATLFDIDTKESFWGTMCAGSVAGLTLGTLLTGGYDREESDLFEIITPPDRKTPSETGFRSDGEMRILLTSIDF